MERERAEEKPELPRRDAWQRRRVAGAEEKLELLRSNDGVRWTVSWRARRTPRAKETCLTRRLGDDERAEGSADDA